MASTAARQAAGWLRRQRRTAARVSAAHTSTPRATTTTSALRRVCSGRMYLQEQGHSASLTVHPILDPKSLFPVSGIGIPTDSLTRPVSNKSSLQGFLELWIPRYYSPIGPPHTARGPGFPALLWSLTLDLQNFFLAFPGPLPHSPMTLTLAAPSPRPSVNTYFSLQGWAPSRCHFIQKVLHYPIFI